LTRRDVREERKSSLLPSILRVERNDWEGTRKGVGRGGVLTVFKGDASYLDHLCSCPEGEWGLGEVEISGGKGRESNGTRRKS